MSTGAGDGIAAAAREVLRTNDTGTLVKAAPNLYPHQWSWDAAFVAIGLATFDIPRALAELEHLRRAQWASGMIPHIVFSAGSGYFPDAARWRTSSLSPPGVATSGICQPAVHAIALRRIRQRAAGGPHERAVASYLERTFDSWLAWHRWLHDLRGADGSGLITIHHGWESGMDNSPRFDAAYARVVPGDLEPFERTDTAVVADAGQRPTNAEYARYLWLVQQLADVGYRDADADEVCDFAVKDVFASAIFAVACDDLATIADELGREADAATLREWAARVRAGRGLDHRPGHRTRLRRGPARRRADQRAVHLGLRTSALIPGPGRAGGTGAASGRSRLVG